MKPPPDADEFGGFCWEACVASILEIPARDVIDVHEVARDTDESWAWWGPFARWLAGRGMTVSQVRYWDAGLPPRPYVAVGPSPETDSRHAVVAAAGLVIYDPAGYDPDRLEVDAVYAIHEVGEDPFA